MNRTVDQIIVIDIRSVRKLHDLLELLRRQCGTLFLFVFRECRILRDVLPLYGLIKGAAQNLVNIMDN